MKTLRPIVSKMTTLPIAGDQVFAAVERLHRNLDAVKQILTDEAVSTVRLVVNPEKMVISEARRTYTYLGLFGYRVRRRRGEPHHPARTSPTRTSASGRTSRPSTSQTVRESFEPVPILTARLFDREMVGVPLLEEMGDEVYGDLDATASCTDDDPIRVRKARDRLRAVDAAAVRLARRHGHPPTGRGALVRVGLVQAQPDPAADAQAHGGPRSELRRRPSRDHLRPSPRPAAAPSGREGAEHRWPRASEATSHGRSGRRAAADGCGAGGCRARLHRRVVPDLHGGDRRAAVEAGRGRASPGRRPRVLPGGQGADRRARRRPQGRRRTDRRSRRSTSGDGEGQRSVQAVGIDVGGTKTAAALVGGDGTVLARETLPTPADDMEATLAHRGEGGASRDDPGGDRRSASRRPGWSIGGPASSSFAPNLAWRQVPLTAVSDRRARRGGRGRQRQHGGGVGRVRVRRGPRVRGSVVGGRRHRHRRRDRQRRQAVPRRPRLRGGDRTHHRGSRWAALRLRQPRVLGTVRVRAGGHPSGRAAVRDGAATILARAERRPTGAGSPGRWSPGLHGTATPSRSRSSTEVGRWLGEGSPGS